MTEVIGGPQAPAQIQIPAHIAGNICKMLERVQVTGMESVAWIEAFHLMQRIATNTPPSGG